MSHSKKNSKKNTPPIHKAPKHQETISELSDFRTKAVTEVDDSTKKIVNSIKEKLDMQEIEDTIYTLESPIEIVTEPVAEAIDNTMHSFNSQVEIEMEFNTESDDTFTPKSDNGSTTLAELLKESFEKTQDLTKDSTKQLVGFYVQHTNQALVINQKWMESINTQIETVLDLQKENLNKYKSLVSEEV